MKRTGWLISKYLLSAVLPYFAFSWLLLSVILFVQQAGRYSDIFFSVNVPANLVWQLTLALIPNVIAFTCPMAMLVGSIIGLTRLQGDSELVAIRGAGVGNLQIGLPILLLGLVLSIFAFFVNSKGVPFAAALVRSVALQTAIKKLESPIEPGVFNSEVAGYTIYVKNGDFETGQWKNIFIYNSDPAKGIMRLITSQNGRIDTTGQLSELVLEDAVASTLPMRPGEGKYVSENIGEVRLAVKTKRSELIEKLTSSDISPDELGLQQLSEYADTTDGKVRTEAEIIWSRRILLSITPLIFAMLGTVIVLRFNRGGRGFGIFLALVVLIGFYLLAFLGEQLARVGTTGVLTGSLIPVVGSVIAILWLRSPGKWDMGRRFLGLYDPVLRAVRSAPRRVQPFNLFVDVTTGLRDFDIISNLIKNFLLTLSFLSAIFVIFTAFELWKYAGTIDGGVVLLIKYLFCLLPFVYLQIAPSAAMIGTLATYVIKSRRNEIVTWTSAGQSVYRLLLPCFLLMVLIGGVNWLIQENVLPEANRRQDNVRNLIRNQGKPLNQSGRYWSASRQRIYSFDLVASAGKVLLPRRNREPSLAIAASDNEKGWINARYIRDQNLRIVTFKGPLSTRSFLTFAPMIVVASDNEKLPSSCSGCVQNLAVYEFADTGRNLQTVYRAEFARWEGSHVQFFGKVEKNELREGSIKSSMLTSGSAIDEAVNPFIEVRKKPNHLNSVELKTQISRADSELDKRNLEVALERRYSTLFLPFVMALFTAPFALSLSRKGKAATVGFAVGLWLLFTGTSTVFEQFGLSGMLTPQLAVRSPMILFALLGLYLLSKVRT
ncbi:MAG: LptF/LptG family permease [Pyrinomonadaceae bacterium]